MFDRSDDRPELAGVIRDYDGPVVWVLTAEGLDYFRELADVDADSDRWRLFVRDHVEDVGGGFLRVTV